MLQIEWADVIATIQSIRGELIAIAVFLALALIVTVAVNRRTVRDEAARKLTHSTAWVAVGVAALVSVSMMLTGPLNTMVTMATAAKHELTEATITKTNKLAVDIEREGITLLRNDDGTLPLAADSHKVNVFGWASTNPIYGGTGSGSMNDQYDTVSILQGLADAGITTNKELSRFYTKYRADRPVSNSTTQDLTLPEPPAATYGDKLIADAKAFSDTAVVVLGRSGGEGFDLPDDMGDIGTIRQSGAGKAAILEPDDPDDAADGAATVYRNNSADYDDFEDGQGYLDLSRTERDMIDLVTRNFDHVVLVYNGANTMNLGFVDDYPQITSVLWAPPAGQAGFTALGEVLTGATNPSGRTADTFLRDFSKAPWGNNFGQFQYDNMDGFAVKSNHHGQSITMTPSFVDYVEGIYVGYKYYETADDEGAIDYDAVVQYPFGYGLSYTTFNQKMGDVTYSGGRITFDVTVTNTGGTAGKDTVEVYYNPPYVNGGIEKASANLIDIAKTKTLEPGESTTVSFSVKDEDMASYDADGAKAYVLDKGDYTISINADSHTVIDSRTVNVPETITYSGDSRRSSDAEAATNRFDDIKPTFTTLSRANHFANLDEATAAPTDFSMPDKYKDGFVNASNYENENSDSDEMPVTKAKNGVSLYQLYGKDYDDPQWDKLLDQLSFDDMNQLIAFAGYGTAAIDSIGKVRQTDVDGPSTLNNNFTGVGSIGLPSGVSVANTFSKELAREFGETIGDMAREMNVTGWYAPAMNIHRTPYAGRNFEYFSEDGVLSGVMAAQEVAGARAKGVYPFIKHFALNDQEANRVSMLCTWADEQTMREIYFKPFEMAVKDGGATAVMTSFNYLGNGYSAADTHLTRDVLRGEWGFRGMVETDYFGTFGYQVGDQLIRSGTDAMLATIDGLNTITDHSATSLKAMRTAAHNILYTDVNSWLYADGEPDDPTPVWLIAMIAADVVLGAALAGLEILAVRRFVRRRRAAAAMVTVESAVR
ncbi:glycoside hydrolase family 3 protein [Bifidobacterium sp. MA2]|uniref:Glycoside hydrolase family 3 protein n=1 Tax=Bifidobacterium santillanense TaxID=2809028 RepID=A0ABS5UNU3_9BIFI|nr:glycoside hydrolase family 3 protein [Bifidobacterium santillanense]MBT1172593.1 glycoside hydrolase family 3 protein [Bifidobacterium santillanense]